MLNPVLRREAKTSLRNWKIYGAIVIYALVITVAAGLFIYGTMFDSYNYGFDPQIMTTLYIVLSILQFGLVLITTPALAAGSISSEREKQTLDLLLVTKMSHFSIVLGKLLSSLGIILLMVVASMPVLAIIFYFGGLSITGLLAMTAFLFVIAGTFGSVSIFFSTIFKKTGASMVLVYLIIAIMGLGTLIVYGIYVTIHWNMYQTEPSQWVSILLLLCNPGMGFVSVVDMQQGTYFIEQIVSFGTTLSPTASFVVEHFWIFNGIINLFITVLFLFLAVKCVNPSRRRRKKK